MVNKHRLPPLSFRMRFNNISYNSWGLNHVRECLLNFLSNLFFSQWLAVLTFIENVLSKGIFTYFLQSIVFPMFLSSYLRESEFIYCHTSDNVFQKYVSSSIRKRWGRRRGNYHLLCQNSNQFHYNYDNLILNYVDKGYVIKSVFSLADSNLEVYQE